MSAPQANPFRSMPFPGSGGEYRHHSGALIPAAQPAPEPVEAASKDAGIPEPADKPDADSGETAPPTHPRRNRSHKE